ncbi:MAG: PHP domain-containing protein [Streptosporangiales bacterium]
MGSNPIGPTTGHHGRTWVPPPDNHVHSQWSHDTGPRASMTAACERAIELGIPSVAFTEHLDFTTAGPGDALRATGIAPNAQPRQPLDIAGYLAGLGECRDRYPALRIVSGVEAGEPHLFAGSATAVLGSGQFDRVLGSVHTLPSGGRLVYASSLLDGRSAPRVMRRYFTEVLALIEGSSLFEVLAHLDFPRRYWPAAAGEYTEGAFEEEYRAVLRALARSGRVLEINTASPLASAGLLRWWREAGGRAVSFGSDAHLPGQVGQRFRDAAGVAAAAGFRPGRDPLDFWRL